VGNPTFNIPDAALLFNDTDPDGQPITVTGISNVVGGSASHNNGVTTYTQVNPFGAGITYTGTSNGLSDTGHITFDRAQVGQSQLDGTDLGEILIGRDNASDTLVGYHGNDVLIGGTGNDTFIFRVGDGKDMVTDFQHASDTIEFDNVNFSTFTDLQSLFHQQGTDLLIAYTATDSVLLKGVSGVSLTASDFVIHHA
jgi:Ca2+-binding RTX toxin-like protein